MKNVKWFLSELALAEPEQYEAGELEIICEDESGREGYTSFEIKDLAENSLKLIESLESKLDEANGRISKALDALDSENLEDVPYNIACALGEEHG
ncbi:hypothetical protein [Pseudoalteromonas sp. SaAl2]